MKTKSPKCPVCQEVMKAIYTKRSFELDGKYKNWWSKEGYLCNAVHSQVVRMDYDWSTKNTPRPIQSQWLLNIYDYERINLLRNLNKILIAQKGRYSIY